MKRFSLLLIVSVIAFSCTKPQITANKTKEELTASALAQRIVPQYADKILFVETKDSVDVFELSNSGKKLVIRGNNANSMASFGVLPGCDDIRYGTKNCFLPAFSVSW